MWSVIMIIISMLVDIIPYHLLDRFANNLIRRVSMFLLFANENKKKVTTWTILFNWNLSFSLLALVKRQTIKVTFLSRDYGPYSQFDLWCWRFMTGKGEQRVSSLLLLLLVGNEKREEEKEGERELRWSPLIKMEPFLTVSMIIQINGQQIELQMVFAFQ